MRDGDEAAAISRATRHNPSAVPPEPHHPPCTENPSLVRPEGRWLIGLAALLLAEVVFLTSRFDSQAMVDGGRWWGSLIAWARYVPQAVMAAAAAALVFARPWAASAPQAQGAADPAVARPRRGVLALGVHLALYGLLVLLTQAVWEGELGRSSLAPLGLTLWGATGLGLIVAWGLALLPAAAWVALARRAAASGVLLAAVAAGAGTCGVGALTGALWQPMGRATLWAVRVVLSLVYPDLVFRPDEAVVGTAAFHVEIAPSCSGYEGIGLIWAFLAVYLVFFRRELRFPQALWLLPLGTAVMWLANVGRIATLIAIGSSLSPEVALGGFHSQAGWLAFNAVALGLVVLSRRLRIFASGRDVAGLEPSAEARRTISPAVAQLGPLMALVATVMLTTALSTPANADLLYPARVLAVAVALVVLRPSHAGGSVRDAFSWQAVAIGVGVFLLWLGLEPAPSTPTPGGPVSGALAQAPRWLVVAWLMFRVVGSVVTVPIAEELAFRGYVIRRLVSHDVDTVAPGTFTWVSFLGSSVLFGLLHGRWLAGVLAGMCYAGALYRRGRLSDAVLAHATTNALIAADVLLTGAWALWA